MKKIQWYFSGLATQEEAEKRLEDMLDWARKSFNLQLCAVESGVRHGPTGFRAELDVTQTKDETSVE
jgi:hypothetical protein